MIGNKICVHFDEQVLHGEGNHMESNQEDNNR